jgi:hypothetical protein
MRTRGKAPPGKFSWLLTVPDGRTFTIRANTKSEARAMLKPLVGLRRKDGLPAGTRGVKLGADTQTLPA